MRFIKDFSTLAILPNSLIKKYKFSLNEDCDKSFQKLKECLTITPILTLPQGIDGYIIDTDASNQGYKAIIMKNDKVVAYASTQLKGHENNYPLNDLELGAIVFSLGVQRHYLYYTEFEIFTNHKNCKYIFTQPDLNLRQRMWLQFIKAYDFSIAYHLGKANIVTNVLSKNRQ